MHRHINLSSPFGRLVFDTFYAGETEPVYSSRGYLFNSTWYQDCFYTSTGKLRLAPLTKDGMRDQPTNRTLKKAEKAYRENLDWYKATGVKRTATI